ncbi:YfgM family protein [Ningiella sp. W23]|uniref:YfgM family protein n=1 Tax=Ningiella sp. W23 TaxID=3023715 RepID=UPI0037580DB0
MERFETEEQQIEAIKRFWKENGTIIIVGVVIGLGSLFGWRYYNDSVISSKETASSAYQSNLESFIESEDASALSSFASEFEDTGYAPLASLIVAQKAVQDEDYASAKTHLSKAAAGNDEIADVAKLRLAKVQLQLSEYEAGLSTLDSVLSDAFADQVNELKGDLLYAQGKFDEAKSAYNLALAELPNDQSIKMKIDNIAYAKTQAVQ